MQRLQSRAQFQAVLAGRTLARTRHFALHCVAVPSPETLPSLEAESPTAETSVQPDKPLFPGRDHWIGAMTPKRAAKRAVTRNAIKRQIYLMSSALKLNTIPTAYVVRLSAAFDKATYPSATSSALKAAVREELVQLFSKAGLAA